MFSILGWHSAFRMRLIVVIGSGIRHLLQHIFDKAIKNEEMSPLHVATQWLSVLIVLVTKC